MYVTNYEMEEFTIWIPRSPMIIPYRGTSSRLYLTICSDITTIHLKLGFHSFPLSLNDCSWKTSSQGPKQKSIFQD